MNTAAIIKHIPGIDLFRTYKREWFQPDLIAGLSVAAVALPVGIAYAQLAGFPPAVGIYSSILPAIAYAFFGSSRQLVVNPDSAACMIVAATIAPLAASDAVRYIDLTILLTIITGLLCMLGGILKFGVIANFLSLPILTGYLNGIALSIIASQLGTLFGFSISRGGFFHTIGEATSRINETHVITFILGVSLFLSIRLLKKYIPKIPAPLIATVAGILIVYFFELTQQGVKVVGNVPSGFPAPHIPGVSSAELSSLFIGGLGIMLVSFCSMMTTARAFAAKNGYRIKVNQDMFALGISDLASGLSGGFAVSGADSRTAVADANGSKSQMTSIIAAIAIALVLLFLTGPLALVPTVALAAILISSAIGLFDISSLIRYYKFSKTEFFLSIVAMLGVMTVGVLQGVLIAVALALFKLLKMTSLPHDAVLEPLKGQEGVYASSNDDTLGSIPGVLIYRYDAPLLFFNADYFKDRVVQVIAESETKPRWFILDAEAMSLVDITGCDALEETRRFLDKEGIVMVLARSKGLFKVNIIRYGLFESFGKERIFYSVHSAVETFKATRSFALNETDK